MAARLHPAASLARLNARAAEINMAIIAESARWGDSKRKPPSRKPIGKRR